MYFFLHILLAHPFAKVVLPVTKSGEKHRSTKYMPPISGYISTAALLLLALARTAVAHGNEEVSGTMNMGAGDMRPVINSTSREPQSYSQLGGHILMIVAHIVLMTIAWIFILPIGVVLSIAKSRRSALVQLAFLFVNSIGLIFAITYNLATPNLYEGNAHHKFGWVLTWIAVAQGLMAFVNTYSGRWKAKSQEEEDMAFIPVSAEAMAEHQRANNSRPGMRYDSRFSVDSGQGTERNTDSLLSHSSTPSLENNSFNTPDSHQEFQESNEAEKQALHRPSRLDQYLSKKLSFSSRFQILGQFLDVFYMVVDRVILILAFVAYLTGLITYSGIFKGDGLFSGLAHFIKGGIFFWYGILTLGRWSGSFADLGWAWNVKPTRSMVGARKASAPSAEFVESFLFFLYGCSNVFLEHLSAWGGEWTAVDLEHISITIMLAGGGLLGMLIESRRVQNLMNMTVSEFRNGSSSFHHQRMESTRSGESQNPWLAPKTYNFSTNPVPLIVVMLLGLIMSSHHQETMVSTMIHKQWGLLFVCVSISRIVTYIVFYLKPPTSYLPGRPPSEVITAFCLMAGGAIFMGSARGVVELLILHNLNAMFFFTVAVGVVMMLMAWEVVVIAIKGWAVRTEQQRSPSASFQEQMQEAA